MSDPTGRLAFRLRRCVSAIQTMTITGTVMESQASPYLILTALAMAVKGVWVAAGVAVAASSPAQVAATLRRRPLVAGVLGFVISGEAWLAWQIRKGHLK